MPAQRPKGPFKVTMHMASFGYREAEPDDIEFMAIIKQVEMQHAVVIDIDGPNNQLEIHAPSRDRAVQAMGQIRTATRLEPGGAKVWHPQVLMAPVKVGKAGFKTLMKQHGNDGVRAYMSPKAGPNTTNRAFYGLVDKWLEEFREVLFRAARQIRVNSSEMRMRVQFGELLLQEWKKNIEEYTYDDLESVIKRLGVRGTFSFDQMLGKPQLAHNLVQKVYASPSHFEPSGSRTGALEHIKPTHTLILTTKNLKIETQVINVQESETLKNRLRLGAARGYRRERRSRAVEIATSCPEHKYDWNLVLRTQVPVGSLPFNHDDLNKCARLMPRSDPNEFPDIQLGDFTKNFDVEMIQGKTAWVFKLQGSPYAIEVAVYHVIAATGEVPEHIKEGGCGVDLFWPAWDEVLEQHDDADGPRDLRENCKGLFPYHEKKLDDKDGVEPFVRRIREIHALISSMDDKPPARLAESIAQPAEEKDLLLSWGN
ncbi:hypothetical protein GE09DRAFT_1287968 [Coniochaeta sp. 2T2.1]|nr:hypothetical protein GE09DRAFT_1287968 [Coniochaeta sp. 2T2.1]